MNRFYLIVPVVLLGVFGGVYWQHTQHSAEAAKAKAELVQQAKVAEEAKKAESERKAREDADRRAAARLAEEDKKQEEKRIRWETEGARLVEETARYQKQAADLARQIAEAEKKIVAQRGEREARARAAFEQEREIELIRIAKRNAELEIQRLTEIVARKAGTSLATN